MAGARAVQQAILNETDSSELSLAMVWVQVMPTDDAFAAALQAKLMPDRRVTHFADPQGNVRTNLVQELISSGPAWDTYIFYGGTLSWTDGPPTPLVWYHQLAGDQNADPSRFRTGDELKAALTATLRAHLGSASS